MSAIIFDFDGTIADSFDFVVKLFYELQHQGPLPADEIERLRGMSLVKAVEDLQIPSWKIPFLLWRGRRQMSRHIRDIQPCAGMSEVISKLYDEGHQLFIVSSNSTSNIQKFLLHNDMNTEFVNVYGGVGLLGKARILEKVIRKNNLDRETTWYVGDEVRDINGARLAKVHIVSVGWGYNTAAILEAHKPDKLVHSATELFKVLEEI